MKYVIISVVNIIMNQDIKLILNKLEENGYEAYIVGGYVRDKLLGIDSTDVDICTNALPKDIKELFNINDLSSYGSFKIKTDQYNFDITTYRKEITYKGRKPIELEYIDNLEEDLKRRDFTINTICMNSNGQIIDLLNGVNDINSKIIRMVGDIDLKIKEDPLRILRALRLSIVLNFSLDKELTKSIISNSKLISSLSYTRKREELDKILVSPNAIHGIKTLKKMNILKYLEVEYKHITYVDDLYGMYAQLNISENYSFNKNEIDTINNIKSIIKNKKINKEIVFNYGLHLSSIAAKIMGINQKKIIKIYNELEIKDKNDIEITGDDIIKLLNIKPSSIISDIYNDLISNILNNKLKNEKNELICYIINNKRKWIDNE